jgi:hypothetical protein
MKRLAPCISGGRRGNALVLAVFILLALTSVGVVSVQRTNVDLMVAGNITRKNQAIAAGEAGMSFGLAVVGSNPVNYLNNIEIQRRGGNLASGGEVAPSNTLTITVAAMSTALPDTDAVNRIPHVALDVAARIRQESAFRLQMTFIKEFKGIPGTSVTADICFELMDFVGDGGIPTQFGETVQQTMTQRDTVVTRGGARAVVGAVKCGLLQ